MRLLPQTSLVKTGSVDHADWNYRPLLGYISQTRFRLIVKLLGQRRFPRLLEIGYGSGVFMPELTRYCDELCGLDPHEHAKQVRQKLREHGVEAALVSGVAEQIPWSDDYFDCIVVVSAFEFVSDLEKVCAEVGRVLVPGGSLIVVTPGHSPVADFGLKLLTGKSAKTDFDVRRQTILPTLKENFKVQRQVDFPPIGRPLLRLYTALELVSQ